MPHFSIGILGLLIMLFTPACADQSRKVKIDKLSLEEFCWGLKDSKIQTIGCSAQDFIIKASLCEIEAILDKEDLLGLNQQQRQIIRSKYRRFKRSYKFRQATLNIESVKLNEILQKEGFGMIEAKEELEVLRVLCSKLTKRAVYTLISIKDILTPEQREKTKQIFIPASRKTEAEGKYPVIPCGE